MYNSIYRKWPEKANRCTEKTDEWLIVVRDGNRGAADGHEASFCGEGYAQTLECGDSTTAL